ncbi:hypothetical protein Bca4012_060181 [Brassica carinata]|uniref:Pectinesterase inhibitor domain-containing protein n=1 Tax=Brassica carinata TaxID=52824 RepID=A0A8X7S8P4_BRACI|nr:hypothetical protein Bca52824_030479 [Brassica carinata]
MLSYLVVSVLLFNCCTANKVADSLIQKSCKEISKYYLGEQQLQLNKDCISSLRENPKSQKARNIDDLILVGGDNAISNLTNVKRIVEKIIKERKYKTSLSKKLLEDCLKLYSRSSHFLTSALNKLKMGKFDDASSDFFNAEDAPIFCELKFNGDNQQISPVKKENLLLITIINIPKMLIFEAE